MDDALYYLYEIIQHVKLSPRFGDADDTFDIGGNVSISQK